ncbi:MAG: hypothetical protein PHD82_14505 [Candidatus Riflebacteria bacterium]|jgi:hypothetical protein|nr:hypothetical protein [Candidatus Riflebacteria bacterium]
MKNICKHSNIQFLFVKRNYCEQLPLFFLQQSVVLLVLASVFLLLNPAYAQLDSANPPTDDLDYADYQKKIALMLPEQPDLLKFEPLCTFRFAPWPEGLGEAAARFEEAFRGYSLKVDNERVLLLDKSGRTLFAYDSRQQKQLMLATDHQAQTLQFDDFALLRGDRLAVADNSRNELLLFAGNRLEKQLGFDGDRILFRHISFVEADRLGLNMVLYDSGRDRTFVFNNSGILQWEAQGSSQPCFMGSSLIRLEKQDDNLKILRFSSISRTPEEIASYTCPSGNMLLDAWVAGTVGGYLAIVVYEGRGDEDHPDYARLLILKDGQVLSHRFMPNLDFRLQLLTPYRLLLDRYGVKLVTARISNAGIEIVAASVPLK